MRIGKLDRRITVQRATYTQNVYGEATETWETLTECWAERLAPTRGNEALTAGVDISTVPVHWMVRYNETTAAITHGDRIQHGGQTHNVLAVMEVNRRAAIRIVTEIVQ